MLTACMIVKNESDILKETLPTLTAVVDELVIVDTGSTDDTAMVAASFGARVVRFDWTFDFAEARNMSLVYATQEWILWIDADEFIAKQDLEALKSYLPTVPQDQLGVMLPIYQCRRGETSATEFYSRVKVFRNNKSIWFFRPINEQLVLPDGSYLQAPLWPETRIYHWGDVDIPEEKYLQKKTRNITLLQEVLKKFPGDFYYQLLLARNHFALRQFDQALAVLNSVSPESIPAHLFEQYWILKLDCLLELNPPEYENVLALMARDYPRFNWVQWKYGALLLAHQQLDEAATVLRSVFDAPCPTAENGVVVDLNDYYYYPHYLLGLIAEIRQDPAGALEHYRAILEFRYDEAVAAKIKRIEGEMP